MLWRLYMLRTWMRSNRDSIAHLWRLGEPVATTASAIAGVDQAPSEDDIVRLADSILSGAFVGDFAVALERAAAFTDVVALGLRVEARRMVTRAEANGGFSSDADEEGRAHQGRPPYATPPAASWPPPRISNTVPTSGVADGWSNPAPGSL